MTRREFVAGGAALAAASATALPTGLRLGAWRGGGKPTARDYAQDGLVAMWDGIENAGFGVHDTNATVWKDLSGNGFDFQVSEGAFNDSGFDMSKAVYIEGAVYGGDILTCEIVVDMSVFYNGQNIFQFYECKQRIALNRWNNAGTMYLIASSYRRPLAVFPEYGVCPKHWTLVFSDSNLGAVETALFDGVSADIGTYQEYKTTSGLIIIGHGNQRGVGKSFRCYNRKLTDEEIAANYAVDKARFGV